VINSSSEENSAKGCFIVKILRILHTAPITNESMDRNVCPK